MSGLDRLRQVAEQATKGPWETRVYPGGNHGVVSHVGGLLAHCGTEDDTGAKVDAEHIATFDPPTVLALIDVAEAAELWCGGEHNLLPRRVASALARLREVSP